MKSQMRLNAHVWICGGPGWVTTQVYPAVLSRLIEVVGGCMSGKKPHDARLASRGRFFVGPWGHAGLLDVGWVLPPLNDAVNTFLAA